MYVLAQVSDVHIGGPNAGSDERLSAAVDELNRMTRQPDLVLFTGDVTHTRSATEWADLNRRLAVLQAPWTAIPGTPIEATAPDFVAWARGVQGARRTDFS